MSTSPPPIGAAPAADGAAPNFEHPSESSASQLIATAVAWPSATLVIVCIRIFTGRYIIKKWHADDFLILVGLAFAIANSVICVIQTRNGAGAHLWEVTMESFKRFLKLGIIGGSLTFNLATLFIKMSILSFYLRFPTERAFRFVTYFLMVVVAGFCIATAFAFLYHCEPREFAWDFTIPGGKCVDLYAAYLAPAAINAATDIIILFMPIWLLWPLRIGPLKKIGVALIMMTGGFVAAVSIVRVQAIVAYSREEDMTWYYSINLMWCLREMYTGIICACLPCLRPFTKHFFPNSFIFSSRLEHRLRSIHIYGSSPMSWGVRDRNKRGSQRLEELDDMETSAGLREMRTRNAVQQNDKDMVIEQAQTRPACLERPPPEL
ncbi:hypothetical protein V8F20_003467 [Naviculisporaceae sp. PSN 640]